MIGHSSILVFIKSPEKGRVKSRLASAFGEEKTLELYKSFVSSILGTLKGAKFPTEIFFYPADPAEAVVDWLGKGFSYIPQRGQDLGERMENAFADSFSCGIWRALIVGTDIPDLAPAVIDEALSFLEDHDAVIGPATDGGYYLIGFKKETFLPSVFHGIPWGTGSVCSMTMQVFARAGYRVHKLPEWRDVDTVDDLISLFIRNRDTDFATAPFMSLCREMFGEKTLSHPAVGRRFVG